MKKTKIAIAVLAVMVLNVVMAASLPVVNIEKVDPQPVEPGEDFTVEAVFANSFNVPTGDFSVSLNAPYPIIFKSSSKDMTRENLCANCKDRNMFFFTVDSRAFSGTYPIYVIASSGSNDVKQQVDIKVVGKPNLIVSTTSGGLNNITPGSEFDVVLDVRNIGTGQARQIEIQTVSQNFIVLGGLVKTADVVDVRNTTKIMLDLVADSNLAANSYTIPISISYLDDQGTKINSTQNIGVKVVNKGEISIQSIKVASNAGGGSELMEDQSFSAVIRLENVGTGDADFITAFAKCPFADEQKSFIGQLKQDEDAPAVFSMTPTNAGKFICNIRVTFQDDTGMHELDDNFQVDVKPSGVLANLLLPIMVIAVLIFLLRDKIPFLKKKK